MTYYELLERTEAKKQKILREFAAAIKGNAGWLVKEEIKRNPGRIAYDYLAKDFCEELGNNIEEYVESVGGYDSYEGIELCGIYQTWYNDEDGLYDLLPVEARLWDI